MKKKIVNLRNAFRKEHAKVNNSMKSSDGAYRYMCQNLVLSLIGVYLWSWVADIIAVVSGE